MRKLIWILALWLGALPSVAQRLTWERPLDFANAAIDVLSYPQILITGEYLVHGVTSPGARYPFIMARYQANGTLVRQQTGRTLFTLEQSLVPLGAAGFLLAASVPDGNLASLFFQRLRPNGDTLPGRRYPNSLLVGYPVRAIRDEDSVRVLTVGIDQVQFVNYVAFVTTDTAGAIGRIRRYANPAPGTAYACDMVRTARGGWLLANEYAPLNGYARPYLQEVDARGRLLRQRQHSLFASTSTGNERVSRIWNNLIRLRDGSGYVFSGQQQAGSQRWGFLCKLDTALNVVWTYRHPPQATANLAPRQVYELPNGSLGWMAGDEGAGPVPNTNKLYYIRVSATGQLLGQRTFTSAACSQLRLYSWQPLPNGGALVVGGYAACGTPGSLVSYTARLDSAATVLAERPGQPDGGGGGVYPNPATASDQATWQGAVPLGAPAAELVLLDVLGRVVRRVPVAGRGPQIAQALDLCGLAAGTYACRLLVAGQPVGAVQRLVVAP